MPSGQRAAPVSAGIQLFKPTYNIRPPVVSHTSPLPAPSTAAVDVMDPPAPAVIRAWDGACATEMILDASLADGAPAAAIVMA
jgi:hypothetical protein